MNLRYISYSITAHVFLVLTVLLVDQVTVPKADHSQAEHIQIEFKPVASVQNSADLARSHSVRAHSSPKGKLLLKDLGIGDYVAHKSINRDAFDSSWFTPDSYATDPLRDFDGIETAQVRFVTSFWREIDKSIWSSPFLSEYGHAGQVFLLI